MHPERNLPYFMSAGRLVYEQETLKVMSIQFMAGTCSQH